MISLSSGRAWFIGRLSKVSLFSEFEDELEEDGRDLRTSP